MIKKLRIFIKNGRSQVRGFIIFDNRNLAIKVLGDLDNKVIFGRMLYV